MDEASAAADPENEYELQQAFQKLMRGKTVIMIAHRLSSIQNVDQILFVQNGKVVEQGTHNELMACNGRYAPVKHTASPIYFKNGYRSKGDYCMNQIALGKRIKAAREKACMTQEELAAAVDYSVDHMSVVERGVKAPKLEKLVAIANALNIGTDELLQDDLNTATMLHATEISERLKMLSPEGQRKVMNVLDALIAELK